jgi:opacity protein-like surface antigen
MSRPSINKSVMLGAALVLAIGATAEAQSTRRIPVQKDRPAPRDTVVIPAATPTVMRDTVWVVRQDTVNMSRVDTVVMIQDRLRRLGGLYFGLGAGASLPVQDFADLVDTGWEVQGTLGWQAPNSPWGVRLDLAYDRFLGQSIDTGGSSSCGLAANSDERCPDASIWSAMLDATLNFPVGANMLNRWRPEVYFMGGVGVHHFPDQEDLGDPGDSDVDDSNTRFGVNGGAGLSIGIGRADLFFETRYNYVKRDEVESLGQGENDSFNAPYMPLLIGVRFGGAPWRFGR